MDRIEGALSIVSNELNRVLGLATFVHDGQRHEERSSSKARHAVNCNTFLGLLLGSRSGRSIGPSARLASLLAS